MPLSIRNRRAEELVRRLAQITGNSMTEVIIEALEDKARRLDKQPIREGALERIMAISRRCASLPTLDNRPEEEILGYGDNGTPV